MLSVIIIIMVVIIIIIIISIGADGAECRGEVAK